MTPAVKQKAVTHLESAHEMSERRACRVIGYARMTVRYRSRRPDDPKLRERLVALAQARTAIEEWRGDYNTVRPHSRITRLTPTDLWTLARVGELIEELTDERYCESGVWRPLKRLAFSSQRPSGPAMQRDEGAVRQWKTKRRPGPHHAMHDGSPQLATCPRSGGRRL